MGVDLCDVSLLCLKRDTGPPCWFKEAGARPLAAPPRRNLPPAKVEVFLPRSTAIGAWDYS
jgi:hypothetical protein